MARRVRPAGRSRLVCADFYTLAIASYFIPNHKNYAVDILPIAGYDF